MSNKPKNCSKVKNACKYCLEQVTNKNGLQCQGACKKWAHYKCLNYTPGKISDIKAGIITVMCPCPDCETTQVKEYLTKPPYSCSNHTCPANAKTAKCDSADCPSNKSKKQENGGNGTMQCSNKSCPTDATEHQSQAKKRGTSSPPRFDSSCPRSCLSPKPKKQPPKKVVAKMSESNSSTSIQQLKRKTSSTSLSGEETISPKNQASMVNALQEMCGTVGKLSLQIKDLMIKINKLT